MAGIFQARDLQLILDGYLSRKFRRLPFESGDIVPTITDLELGTVEIVRRRWEESGKANVIADDAFDLPVVDIASGEDTYKVLPIASAFSFTLHEIEALTRAGRAAEAQSKKIEVCRRAIAERNQKYAAFGDPRYGITGFLNNGSVLLDVNSFNPWTATGNQLFEFFVGIVSAMDEEGNYAYTPNRLAVSPRLHYLLTRKMMSDSAISVLSALLSSEYFDAIVSLPECSAKMLFDNGIGNNTRDRIVAYSFDVEILERHVSAPQMVPDDWVETHAMRRVFPMMQLVSPVIVNHPKGMRYIDVIKEP